MLLDRKLFGMRNFRPCDQKSEGIIIDLIPATVTCHSRRRHCLLEKLTHELSSGITFELARRLEIHGEKHGGL